jgi:hypothetical protein
MSQKLRASVGDPSLRMLQRSIQVEKSPVDIIDYVQLIYCFRTAKSLLLDEIGWCRRPPQNTICLQTSLRVGRWGLMKRDTVALHTRYAARETSSLEPPNLAVSDYVKIFPGCHSNICPKSSFLKISGFFCSPGSNSHHEPCLAGSTCKK